MKQEKDYIQDIAEIRSMMERSSKFLSLSGWSGVLAGVYALIGAGVAHFVFRFGQVNLVSNETMVAYTVTTAVVVLLLSISTAIYFSRRKALRSGQSIWNPISRKMILNMGVPLVTGGILALILLDIGANVALSPVSLIFYGLALFNAGSYTFKEIKILGLIQVVLGLLAFYFIDYGIALWALGFGVMHIIYGAYIHYKHER